MYSVDEIYSPYCSAMSNDNFAIEIDPPDDEEIDLETGITSSRCALMQNFEEERPTSLVASIKESARSSSRKARYYCSFLTGPLKKLVSKFKLLIIIAIYSFLGAHLFMYLEVPTDIADKVENYHRRKIAREIMILNLRAIHYDNKEDREERWKHAVLRFENDLDLGEPEIETAWTFWMAFLYAGTIFTTIGYGNIACKTRAGQIATMIYAFAGIPIMLVILNSLNNFLLKWIKIIANTTADFVLYYSVRLGIAVIRQEEQNKKRRFQKFSRKFNLENSTRVNSDEGWLNCENCEDEEDEIQQDPPIISTIFATVSWIMFSAAVFCIFEDWSFFTSFYFCFISLTTIGLGDVTPENPEYMIATFGVVLIGLSMLTVCIDVVKEKIALMYMALLQKLLREYMEAVQSGDPNAASAMMTGFQGKAKFLMPLISKNEGAKVMNKFKEDCSKKVENKARFMNICVLLQGIDPPPVLTNINPETGMPAFANASKDEFNDYIEVAEEKFAEQQQKLHAQTPISKTSTMETIPARKTIVSTAREVQTEWKRKDLASQTSELESSDEGIQTDYSDFEEPKPIMVENGTQYENRCVSTGIQPEVSSIYNRGSSEWDIDSFNSSDNSCYDDEDMDEDVEEDEENEIYLTPGSPEIEITHAESVSLENLDEKNVETNTLKVLKSASMDSAETVIDVMQKKQEEHLQKQQMKEIPSRKKRRMKKKRANENELRFLKSSGLQVMPMVMDCGTQYEIDVVDCGIQYSIINKNRRCQTKLSSMNQEQLYGLRESKRRKHKKVDSDDSRPNSASDYPESESERSHTDDPTGEISTEINFDLSVIAIGVDGKGKIIQVPKDVKISDKLEMEDPNNLPSTHMIRDERQEEFGLTFEQYDNESEEEDITDELELFTMESHCQTDAYPDMIDREISINPVSLEICRNLSTQTTISTFHRKEMKYSSESSSSSDEDDRKKMPKSEVYFQTESSTSTSDLVVKEWMDKELQTEEKNLLEEECQATEDHIENCSQTDKMESTSECQTETAIIRDIEIQTIRETNECTSQTILREFEESENQTEVVDLINAECQTYVRSYTNTDSQTEIYFKMWDPEEEEQESVEKLDLGVQTVFNEYQFAECQTEISETSATIVQTEEISLEENHVQTDELECETTECQTENNAYHNIEIQTVLENKTTESQTEHLKLENLEIQTEILPTSSFEVQTESTEVPKGDKSSQSTLYETKDTQSQHSPNVSSDANVQASSECRDSETQYFHDTDIKSSQTELTEFKNKRSQILYLDLLDEEGNVPTDHDFPNSARELFPEIDDNIPLIFTNKSSMTDSVEIHKLKYYSEKEVQVEEDDLLANLPSFDSAPLWSDFDYVPNFDEEDDETQTAPFEEEESNDSESTKQSIKSTPSYNNVKIQTAKQNKLNIENMANRPETRESVVQASVEVSEQEVGVVPGSEEDWLQVYVRELDEARRMRMSDIGIQTGVLARVQHMYTLPISDDVAAGSAPITLRKSSESSDHLSGKFSKGSSESLGPSSSVLSAAESMDDRLWGERSSPFSSRPSSMKRHGSTKEKKSDRSNIVTDLRARFEASKSSQNSPNRDEKN